MTDRSSDLDKLSADIRRLAAGEQDDRPSDERRQDDEAPLELTSVVEPADEPDDQPMVLTDLAEHDGSREAVSSAARVPAAPPEPAPAPVDHSIRGTLAKLEAREHAMDAAQSAGPTVSDRPLDEIVRETLRPMLWDWLDRNLERIVREEVAAQVQADREVSGSRD